MQDVPAVVDARVGRSECLRPLAILAVAAGKVEVALEVARLANDRRPTQDEVVGVEQATEIDVGENTRRRRIAGALEAVEFDRGQRIAGRELVDDEHRPARAQDSIHLGQHELGPRDVVQRARRRDEVEGGSVERERSCVALDELDVRGRALATLGKELGNEVDADDLADERSQRDRERARAGADVEGALVPGQGQQVGDSFARLRRAPVLLRGDERGRLREPPPYFSGFVPAIQMMTLVNRPSALMSKKLQLCMSFFVPSESSPM